MIDEQARNRLKKQVREREGKRPVLRSEGKRDKKLVKFEEKVLRAYEEGRWE